MADSAGYIGNGLELHGKLMGAGDIVIDGRLSGECHLRGRLAVGRGGQLRGTVQAEAVFIEGVLEGPILATEVIVREGGHVTGHVRAQSVGVEDGGALHGLIDMDVEMEDSWLTAAERGVQQ